MSLLLIYTARTSSRLVYVLDFIFQEVLQIQYKIVSDPNVACHILYDGSKKPTANQIQIIPCSLLFEKDIQEQDIHIQEWCGLKTFFTTSNATIPFDLFAATFYLISRYEEYLPYEKDIYQRFPHTQSVAFKHRFIKTPLIDYWILELKKRIQEQNPAHIFPKGKAQFIATYDIDSIYSYTGKSMYKQIGGTIRDLLEGQFSSIKKRISTRFLNQKDPFDTFDYLDSLHQYYALKPIYFLLLSQGGKFDKNIHPEHPSMQHFISYIKDKYEVGIHPSYKSHDDISYLKKEFSYLPKVSKSRQHFIRFQIPETYQNLIKLGIQDEYSMGYGSINGFRASTSHSFYWFDLSKNSTSTMRIHPFCFMECNSYYEQKDNIEKTQQELLLFLKHIQATQGTMICIWHNFSFSDMGHWKGWKTIYEQFLSTLKKEGII
ncbi:MAG: polysaccharide deacetylase family protein [Chitinophagaceae bacterium]